MLVVKKISIRGKSNEELPEGIGDDYSYSPLVIDEYLKMGGMSGGNFLWKTTFYLNSIVIPIMAMWVVDMV